MSHLRQLASEWLGDIMNDTWLLVKLKPSEKQLLSRRRGLNKQPFYVWCDALNFELPRLKYRATVHVSLTKTRLRVRYPSDTVKIDHFLLSRLLIRNHIFGYFGKIALLFTHKTITDLFAS